MAIAPKLLRDSHELIGFCSELSAISRLPFPARHDLLTVLESKLLTLCHGVHSSHYLPSREASNDPLNLNSSPAQAILTWLRQFPEEHRLAALLTVCSITYIGERESHFLFDQACQHLDRIRPNPHRNRTVLGLSNNEFVKRYIAVSKKSGSKDQNEGQTLADLVDETFYWMRYISEEGLEAVYSEKNLVKIKRTFDLFYDRDIVLVEDGTFSGTTIKSDLKRLSQLLYCLFEPFRTNLSKANVQLPTVYVLVNLATDKAVETVNEYIQARTVPRTYMQPIVTGHTFDGSMRINDEFEPHKLQEISALSGGMNFRESVVAAHRFFHSTFSSALWSEPLLQRSSLTKDDCVFGYRNGGWLTLPHHNVPNNAPPMLWYPGTSSGLNGFHGLFPRNESRITHDPTISATVEDNAQICLKNVEQRDGNLRLGLLTTCYAFLD